LAILRHREGRSNAAPPALGAEEAEDWRPFGNLLALVQQFVRVPAYATGTSSSTGRAVKRDDRLALEPFLTGEGLAPRTPR